MAPLLKKSLKIDNKNLLSSRCAVCSRIPSSCSIGREGEIDISQKTNKNKTWIVISTYCSQIHLTCSDCPGWGTACAVGGRGSASSPPSTAWGSTSIHLFQLPQLPRHGWCKRERNLLLVSIVGKLHLLLKAKSLILPFPSLSISVNSSELDIRQFFLGSP